MKNNDTRLLNVSEETRLLGESNAIEDSILWLHLCEDYLPIHFDDSVWRLNRKSKPQEPSQGWKLHISATILDACNLLERVAPFLNSEDVQFKAPKSLDELTKLNCGLHYGYHQVGKFITVYPFDERQAVDLAQRLHDLTEDFVAISVPYDERFLPESSVFYRYGAFSTIEATDKNGESFKAIKDPSGEFVLDDRMKAVPDWLSDPFPKTDSQNQKTFDETTLGTTYKVFDAITQRGKGGTYQAVDLSQTQPRLCVVKEGRKSGEVAWNGQDGYFLVKNEFDVLKVLKEKYSAVPQAYSSFEIYGNFYFAMEYVEGKSLRETMNPRKRRFSIRQVVEYGIEIAKIIENIHRAGWVWNDCKPGNLIVTTTKMLRPIDFEGAFPANKTEPFDWKTKGFSKSEESSSNLNGKSNDVFSLGAVLYFLLTGSLFDSNKPLRIEKLRRNVPQNLIDINNRLISDSELEISTARAQLEEVLNSLTVIKG